MASIESNPYAKLYTNHRIPILSSSSPKKKYSLIFFPTENKYSVEKTKRVPAANKNGIVLIEGVQGTIIREGSKESCTAAANALEKAIATDTETNDDISIEKQKRLIRSTKPKPNKLTTMNDLTLPHISPPSTCTQKPSDHCSEHDNNEVTIVSLPIVSTSSKQDGNSTNGDERELVDLIDETNKTDQSPPKKKRKTNDSSAESHKRMQPVNDSTDRMEGNPASLSADLAMLNYLKKIDTRNIHQLKRLIVGQERLERSMKNLFDNQKKIQKAFCAQQVFLPFKDSSFTDHDDANSDEVNNDFHTTLIWPPNVEDDEVQRTDVLKIPGNRSNINAYVLKLVGVCFGREGLECIETKDVSSHDGYLFIKEATRQKFRISKEEFDVFWPCAHEAIMQKRRNLHRSLKVAGDKKGTEFIPDTNKD